MRYAGIALLSTAALSLLSFATPVIAQAGAAELGHPSGCAQCSPVTVAAPAQGSYRAGAPVIGPWLSFGVPPGATALAPETGVLVGPRANRPHVEIWDQTYPRQYHTVSP